MSCAQTYTWCTTGHKLGKWQCQTVDSKLYFWRTKTSCTLTCHSLLLITDFSKVYTVYSLWYTYLLKDSCFKKWWQHFLAFLKKPLYGRVSTNYLLMLILIICLIGTLYSLYISTLNFINRCLFMNSAFCLQNSMDMGPSEVSCGVWCWFVGLYGSCVDPADPQKQNMEVWRLHQCPWSFLMLFKQFFSRLCAFAEIIGW